ncbi:MAG: antirestriction protein ArdA, partial [Lentilitoribacter sp.]
LSEYQGIESVRDIACFLFEYDEFGAALLDYWSNDIEDAKKAAEGCYQGVYDSLADYAQAITEDTTEIPSHLAYYIDYERLGRDIEMNGDVYTLEKGYQKVYVFSHH